MNEKMKRKGEGGRGEQNEMEIVVKKSIIEEGGVRNTVRVLGGDGGDDCVYTCTYFVLTADSRSVVAQAASGVCWRIKFAVCAFLTIFFLHSTQHGKNLKFFLHLSSCLRARYGIVSVHTPIYGEHSENAYTQLSYTGEEWCQCMRSVPSLRLWTCFFSFCYFFFLVFSFFIYLEIKKLSRVVGRS